MHLSLRPVAPDEFPRWLRTLEGVFGSTVGPKRIEEHRRTLPLDRTIAAYDGDDLIGTAGDYPFVFTVPGGKLAGAGVTCVSVRPTHRRRGVLREMMTHQLHTIRDRGEEPIAVLWASEGHIYGRFGYGMATWATSLELDRDRAVLKSPPAEGARMRILEDKAIDVLAPIYERVCDITPGFFERTGEWWEVESLSDSEDEREGGSEMFCALLELDGRPEGFALYRLHPKWDVVPVGKLDVIEAIGTSPLAVREIWRFLIGVDLVRTIESWAQPYPHPLQFALTEPRRLRARINDGLFVRIVDVARALEARTYATEDSVVLRLHDDILPDNSGNWRLSATADGAVVSATDEPADIECPITDLGATYLGGTKWSELELGGSVIEQTPGALRRADGMFASAVAPWCPEVF
jgi:predicted acetyltransferase